MSEAPWWEVAIREHEKQFGPSGGAWNISMILQRLHSAHNQEMKTTDMGFRCPKCESSKVKLLKTVTLSYPPQHCWRCLDCDQEYSAPISKRKP